MKILFVTHRFPYPTVNHAGGVLVFNIIKALGEKGISIDLLSFINEDEYQYLPQMKNYCETIELVSSRKKIIEHIIDLPAYFIKPKFIIQAFQRRFVRKLTELQKNNKYDIIQMEWTPMCQYVNYVRKNTAKILTEHDVTIIPQERHYLKLTNVIKKVKRRWTLKMLKKYEPKLCAKFDLVLTVSKKDSDFLKKINPTIKTFEYPIFINKIITTPEPPSNKKILFLGHLGRVENIEAVEWFYMNVFVDINKIYPDVIFYIVGAEPQERIMEIAKNKNVQLYSNVEHPEEFYKDVRVFVSPLLIGGGIIMKNLHAMGLGCPLITTSIGNEGITGIDGKDILIADTKEEFINKLNIVLNDDNIWRMLSINGKLFIDKHYNFNSSIDKLIEQYNSLVIRMH
jgi:glycosyltransferase involved in cell wall biosynthesis